MGVKVGTSCLHWIQPSVPQFSQILASLKRCSFTDGELAFKHIRELDRTALFGTRTRSRPNSIRRVCSASADSSAFSDDEFEKQFEELKKRFHTSGDRVEENNFASAESESVSDSDSDSDSADLNKPGRIIIDWQKPEDDRIFSSIEWKANSVDLPLSIRMIKRKRQWQEGLWKASESACCSVKKAFSSMVFIIRELNCFTIQMKETILYEDLRKILSHVRTEMHSSFVWLFQQVFSHTPTLMVYVMILLANYSVHSMTAVAAPPRLPPATESVSIQGYKNSGNFDQSSVRDFSLPNSGKTASVGGSGRGGGNLRPVSSGMGGGGNFRTERMVVPDGVREESVCGQEMVEEEVKLWNSIVDETTKMQSEIRTDALDHEIVRRFVSPVSVKVETDDYADYFRTELFYRMGLAEDPINPLLLANFAQFLYLVAHDYDRAEEYFKRAVKVEPPDAEALRKYASFLWHAKKDLWCAEETYLEAISADPTNSYYAANYAHFLWSTGGEDTCYPLDGPDSCADNA